MILLQYVTHMQATLSLIKQGHGEYEDGCFIYPIKASHWIIFCHFVCSMTESCCGEICMKKIYNFFNGANVPSYVYRI
jgi:hypothetical protein